jgi:hypothetical protein
MVMSPAGLGTKNNCAGEGQQQCINEAIEDWIRVKNKCEVEYTPFLSLLCSWRLDGVDSWDWIPGKGEMFLFSKIQTGSGANQASYTVSTGGSFAGEKNLSNLWLFLYEAIIDFSSSFISYRIPSNAGYFG